MSELRAGVIGYGYTGRLHLEAYEHSGVHVAAVAETRPDVLATAPPQTQRFPDYLELLRSDIDVVSICAPTSWHHRITLEDAAQMSLGFPSGRCAQIMFGLLPEPHPLICDLELIGTRGSVVVHTWKGYEYRRGGQSDYRATYVSESHAEKVVHGIGNEVKELCAAIQEGRDPRPSVDESTQAFRVVMAFYRASESGTIQQPEYKDG